MHAMNGVVLGSKQLVVRLHEPKQLRQEKLAQRFGGHGNGHPRSGSGATSPTASEAGDYSGWSPTHRSAVLGSPIMGHAALERTDRGRRSSGSYYHVCPPSFSIEQKGWWYNGTMTYFRLLCRAR